MNRSKLSAFDGQHCPFGAESNRSDTFAPGENRLGDAKMGTKTIFLLRVLATMLLSITCVRAADSTPLLLQIQHTATINTIAYSPDGRLYVTGSSDKTLHIRDSRSHLLISVLHGDSNVTSAVFSSDGKFIFSGGGDGTIKQWLVSSGELVRTFGQGKTVNALAISPKSSLLLKATDDDVQIWDVESPRLLRALAKRQNDEEHIHDAKFSPDGKTVLIGAGTLNMKGKVTSTENDLVELWSVADGSLVRRFNTESLDTLFNLGGVRIAFSPDGNAIAAGSGCNSDIRIWSVNDGTLINRLKTTSTVDPNKFRICKDGLIFSTDSSKLLMNSTEIDFERNKRSSLIRAYDISSGKLSAQYESENPRGEAFGFSSVLLLDKGKTLVASGNTGVHYWNIDTSEVTRKVGTEPQWLNDKQNSAFSSDGTKFYWMGGDGSSREWSTQTGQLLKSESAFAAIRATVVGFASDSIMYSAAVSFKQFGSGFGNAFDVAVQNRLSGEAILHRQGAGVIHSMDVASNGQLVWANPLLESGKRYLVLWSAQNSQPVREFGSGWMNALKIAPNEKKGISARRSGELTEWDLVTGKASRSFGIHSGVTSLAYSPDGKVLASGGQSSVKLWSVKTGKQLRSFDGSSGLVSALGFSPNSRSLLAVSGDTVTLREMDTGRISQSFKARSNIVAARFSVTGERILTLGEDRASQIWNRETGELLATFYARSDGEWITITPEGFFSSSRSGGALLAVVHGLEVQSIDQVYQALYRPDLVREKLAGDPDGKVRAAAVHLDLDKVMASGVAPKVTITSPAFGASSDTDEAVIDAIIVDQGGGIGKVEWRVNGVTLGLEARGLDRIDAPATGGGAAYTGKTETVKRTLALEPGDNRIEVLAYNAKGLIASEPAQVTIKWDGTKTTAPPKLYVLAVGVNDYYDGRLRLTYAVPDATALAEGFRKAGNGLYAGVEVRTVLDSEVTLTNLDKVFAEMSQKVKPRDVFVFFLAGHGKTKNGRYYFLPRDFRYEDETSIERTSMGQDKFQAWFASIPARKSLLLYDTCESGSLTGANARGSDVDERLGALNRMARATGRTFLTATTDDAPALEGFRGHGVFTYALLEALDRADTNNNSLIEISELADYIQQKVEDYSYETFKMRQVPQRSIVGSNFALTNKAQVLTATSSSARADAPISIKPTHVIVAPVDVRATANETANSVAHLTPGTQVRLIETANGWMLIARDGQKLGYVRGNVIAGLQ
jgi:WD40 repeat protein/uncharacterized caspase-like protein